MGDRHKNTRHPEGRDSRDRQGLRDRKWTQGQGKTESQGPRAKDRSTCDWREEDHRESNEKGRESKREREEKSGDGSQSMMETLRLDCWCLTTWDLVKRRGCVCV